MRHVATSQDPTVSNPAASGSPVPGPEAQTQTPQTRQTAVVPAPQAPPAGSPARQHRRTETARLLQEARDAADPDTRAALQDQAIQLNMQVAAEIAQRYHGRGIPGDDLDQVAFLGLTKAVRGFDPSHGSDFLSFAVPTIRGEIRRYFRDFGWTVRPPRWVQELQPRITAAEGELFQQLGRSPRPSELARYLEVDLDRVLDALGANGCFSPASLDAPYGEAEVRPVDRLGDTDGGFDGAEARVALAPLLAKLTPRERKILELRFGAGLTQAEIGAEVGVTQMQISRLLSRLLKKLRADLKTDVA